MRKQGCLAVATTVWIAAMGSMAAAGPVYRDPPSYKGIKKAPPTVAAPAPQAPPPLTLSGAGNSPDVLVDEAGTAHVVWNQPGGELPDAVGYCRIKRGATACDTTATLQSEIDPTDPNARYDDTVGLEIERVGDQLLVFSKRYPIVRDKPDGASSSTVIAWSSGDGGTTWTPRPSVIGKWNIDRMVVIGGAEDAALLSLGIDPLCSADGPSGVCLTAFRSGEYSGAAGNLSTQPNQGYFPNLTLDAAGLPVMSVSDLNYDTFVRRWRGTGAPTDPTQWTAPSVLPADQAVLAGGPAGVFMMSKPKTGGAYSVQRLDAQGESYAARPGRTITPERDSVLGELHQGPDGRLIAAWSQRDGGLKLRATGGAARATPAFAPAKTIATGGGNGQIALGAAADGGGFTVFNHTAGIVGDGEIQVAGFGTQLPTNQLGVADVAGDGLTPGGAGTEGRCGQLSFGQFTVETAQGCLLKGTGNRKNEYVTSGEVNLWGVRIVPDAGVKIVIDPKLLQLDTTGDVRVIVTAPEPIGDVVLFHGRLQRDLSKVVPGTNLFEFPSGLFKANLLGFDVGADIDVRLERDGVHIPLDLKLPAAFGGFSGHAELVADRVRGLRVDTVNIHIGPVPLGALVINSVDLTYQGGDDLWTGKGSLSIAGAGTLDLEARFGMGQFKGAAFSFEPGQPIPIGPFVYLLQFGGGFFLDPVVIDASATIGAGAAVNGEAPLKVRGDLKMTFPPQGPGDFRLKGAVSVFLFQIADGELNFQTDGYAAFRGHAGVELGPLEVDVNMDGFIDGTTGQYGASLDGRVDLCVKVDLELEEIRVCGGARAGAAVSSKGFAACARINPPDPVGGFEVGLTYPWSDWSPAFLLNPVAATVSLLDHIGGCHVEDYKIAPTRARASQSGPGTPVMVPAGLPSQTILVKGAGGRPRVSVTGPDGRPVGTVMSVDDVDAAYVMLDKPAAGEYRILTKEGSAPIAEILTADGYEPARVDGTLGGKGRRRTIRYTLTRMGHGQRVVFQESGKFGTHVLGTAESNRGTLRFRPADAAGGRRTVVALVQREGLVTDTIRVGTYTAPGPERPGKVRRLRGTRKGNSLVVSWAPARGAARYAVTVKGAKGTRLGHLVPRGTRRVAFGAVRREERVTVRVRALSRKLRPGPAVQRVVGRG